MADPELLKRISIDPQVCGGKAVVRGTRIWVSRVLDLLAEDLSREHIIANYPPLTNDDVLACLAYGAMMTSAGFVDIDIPEKKSA